MKKLLLVVSAFIACVVVLRADTQLATDDFQRGNESPLASPWTAPDSGGVGGGSNLFLNSNHVEGQGLTTFQLMYYSGPTWPDDQAAKWTIGGTLGSNIYAGAAVRIQASGQGAYVFGATNQAYKISPMSSGALGTAIATCTGTPTAGDVVFLTVTGDTLTGLVNGSEPGTCHGSGSGTYTSGSSGGWGYGSLAQYTMDDYFGYSVSAAGPTCRGSLLLLGAGGCNDDLRLLVNGWYRFAHPSVLREMAH